MKQIFYATLAILLSFALFTSCANRANSGKENATLETGTKSDSTKVAVTETNQDSDTTAMKENPNPIYEIHTTEGTIVVQLYDDTPLHKRNFEKLVAEKFYDGILFHRVIRGFMIQTGDPLTKDPDKSNLYGTGGPGYTIPAEILPNHNHKKGALAAARRGDMANPKKESSGSQFYIVQDENTCSQLDGEYTVFGETIDGIGVIDKIASIQTRNDRPVKDVRIISINPVE